MIHWRLRQVCGVGCSFGEKNNNNMMVETNLWDETKIGIYDLENISVDLGQRIFCL